jgi:hypothetical protein
VADNFQGSGHSLLLRVGWGAAGAELVCCSGWVPSRNAALERAAAAAVQRCLQLPPARGLDRRHARAGKAAHGAAAAGGGRASGRCAAGRAGPGGGDAGAGGRHAGR